MGDRTGSALKIYGCGTLRAVRTGADCARGARGPRATLGRVQRLRVQPLASMLAYSVYVYRGRTRDAARPRPPAARGAAARAAGVCARAHTQSSRHSSVSPNAYEP